MSNIICNNIISSDYITLIGDFVLRTNNSKTMTVNRAITETGSVGITSGTGKIKFQSDVEILENKTFTTKTGTININGLLNLTNVTPSTGWTAGAITIQGGIGVMGNINSGENISCFGNLNVVETVINSDNILLKI